MDNITITLVDPYVQLLTPREWILEYPRLIELFGRVCYKSEERIAPGSAKRFIKMLMASGHHSVLEHLSITVKMIGDRAMSHQLVRHRLAAYSQESQRYCNYGKKGFHVICPEGIDKDRFTQKIEIACKEYLHLLALGHKPEDARILLPNAMKTEVVTTYNLRQWRHVFKHRALNPKAQKQIRYLTSCCLKQFAKLLPEVFEDLSLQLLPDSTQWQ